MTIVTQVDTVTGRTVNGGPTFTGVWQCSQYTVRIRIAHDSYRDQSYALAEVFTPVLTWTELCAVPPEEFHYEAFGRHNKATADPTVDDLQTLAAGLVIRACRILRVTTGQASPPPGGSDQDERAGHGHAPAAVSAGPIRST